MNPRTAGGSIPTLPSPVLRQACRRPCSRGKPRGSIWPTPSRWQPFGCGERFREFGELASRRAWTSRSAIHGATEPPKGKPAMFGGSARPRGSVLRGQCQEVTGHLTPNSEPKREGPEGLPSKSSVSFNRTEGSAVVRATRGTGPKQQRWVRTRTFDYRYPR